MTLSDKSDLPECLERSRHSCTVNGLETIAVKGITWGRFDHDLINLPPVDMVIAADCFYDSKGSRSIVTVIFCLAFDTLIEPPCLVSISKAPITEQAAQKHQHYM